MDCSEENNDMIDALFNQSDYVGTKRMLDATAMRMEAISSNIANLETPGYKRVDLAPTFTQTLSRAINAQDSAQIAATKPGIAVDTSAPASNRDGNTVHMEKELLFLSQNTLAHSLETQLITRNLNKLRTAINNRPA